MLADRRFKPCTIQEFGARHNLIMKVVRRSAGDFYAKFEGAEVREGAALLRSAYGDGATPKEAIRAYADEISGHLLIVDAYKETRREIKVPRLTDVEGQES